MARDSTPPDPQALLQHAAWIRRLAGTLVAGSFADDVAQETLLAACAKPPREESELRGWLATVARRVASRLRWREAQRRLREEAAARREALAPTDELVARAALERSLVDAVLALDDPWRTTVLMRWFDGRPPRAIAREMGVPIETVRTRLKRALELLRERLVAERGARDDAKGRRELALLLIDVSKGGGGAAAVGVGTVLGGLAMTVTGKTLVAAAIVAGAVVAWRSLTGEGGEAARTTGVQAARTELAAPEEPIVSSVAVAERREAAAPIAVSDEAAIATSVASNAAGEPRVVGVVRDEAGKPVAEAIVLAEPASATRYLVDDFDLVSHERLLLLPLRLHDPTLPLRASTDAEGRFELPAPAGDSFHVASLHGDHGVTLLRHVVATPPTTTIDLAFDAGVVLAGSVCDVDGAPIAGASIGVMAYQGPGGRGRGGSLLDLTSDAEGRFRSMPLPRWYFRLGAWADGFVGNTGIDVEPTPGQAQATVDFRLERTSYVHVRLVDPDGAPWSWGNLPCELEVSACRRDPRGVADPEAEIVSGGGRSNDGSYRLDPAIAPIEWIALFAGDRVIDAAPLAKGDNTLTVDVALLQSLLPKGRLSLLLVDEATGRWPAECTLMLFAQRGSLAPAAFAEIRRLLLTDTGEGCELNDLRDSRKPAWQVARAADGTLPFPDLDAGSYSLVASTPGGARAFAEVRVVPAAGAHAPVTELRLEAGTRSVRGRVVGPKGAPIDGVTVRAVALDGTRIAPDEGDATCDAEGRFEFTGLPEGECFVVATPPRPSSKRSPLELLAPPAPCAARVAARAEGEATAVEVDLVLPHAVRLTVVPRLAGREWAGPWSCRVTDAQGARLRDDMDRSLWIEIGAESIELLVPPGRVTIEVHSRRTQPMVRELLAERALTLPLDAEPRR